MKSKVFVILAFFILATDVNTYAEQKPQLLSPDSEAMEQVLKHYAKIHRDLVSESRGQIKDDASTLLIAARKLKDKELSTEIESATKKMIADSSTGMGHPSVPRSIDDFKKLSAPIVSWVKKNKPEGWSVIHCSMKDADWVQKSDQNVQNPYTGKEMQSCGEKVS